MIIYLDASALGKLVAVEAESAELQAWLASRDGSLCTNLIGAVELQRTAARLGGAAPQRAQAVLARVVQFDLTGTALQFAARLEPPAVRTLDALHIASAYELNTLGALVTYDMRMKHAAETLGLPVVSPGA